MGLHSPILIIYMGASINLVNLYYEGYNPC